MSQSSESAEQFVRLVLDETEFALKITGSAVKNIVAALYVISKDTSNKTGRASLSRMLKSEQELKIFSVKAKDMKIFVSEAKKYGVYYCVLDKKNEKNDDGLIDIMVPANDAPKVNRIVERFNLDTADVGAIESSIEREMVTNKENNKDISENEPDLGVEPINIEDSMIDDIFSKPLQKEEMSAPLISKTEKSPQLENSSESKIDLEGTTKKPEKKSVRQELKEIKKEQQLKELYNKEKEVSKKLNSKVEIPKVKKEERGK